MHAGGGRARRLRTRSPGLARRGGSQESYDNSGKVTWHVLEVNGAERFPTVLVLSRFFLVIFLVHSCLFVPSSDSISSNFFSIHDTFASQGFVAWSSPRTCRPRRWTRSFWISSSGRRATMASAGHGSRRRSCAAGAEAKRIKNNGIAACLFRICKIKMMCICLFQTFFPKLYIESKTTTVQCLFFLWIKGVQCWRYCGSTFSPEHWDLPVLTRFAGAARAAESLSDEAAGVAWRLAPRQPGGCLALLYGIKA